MLQFIADSGETLIARPSSDELFTDKFRYIRYREGMKLVGRQWVWNLLWVRWAAVDLERRN